MAPKFLKKLFAEEGEIEEIPDPSQPSGVVSMTTGYGYDYERDPSSDPMAKDIERKKMNWLFRTITEGLQRFQTVGTHPFIAPAENGGTAYAYIKGARCMYASALYESLVDNNTTLPTDKTKWRDISAGAQNWAAAAHSHGMGDITGLPSALAGKAAATHGHAVGDVSGLSNVLASYVLKTLKIIGSGPLRINTGASADLNKDITISVNDASETAAGISERATAAEAVAGVDKERFLTPATSNRVRYIGGVNALDNSIPSGATLYIADPLKTLTLMPDIEVGKKFFIFLGTGSGYSIVPPVDTSIYVRGGIWSTNTVGVVVALDGMTGRIELLKTASNNYHLYTMPDVGAAITARLASNAAMLEKAAKDVAVTPYGLTVMQIIDGAGTFSDLNNAKVFGSYIVVPSALNNPFASAGYLHVNFGSGTSVYMTQQFNSTSGRLAIRGTANGGSTWSAWTELAPNAPGQIGYFAQSTPPPGWIKANGAAVSRTTYAALYAAIGTTHGAGNGSTTFNVPDGRGEFVRGWDDGRGIDAGRVLGSAQSDEFRSHTHQAQGGVHSGGGPGGGGGGVWYGTVTTTAAGGAETRPRNVALLACIKY